MPARRKYPSAPLLPVEICLVYDDLRRFYAEVDVSIDISPKSATYGHIAIRVGLSQPRFVGLPETDAQWAFWDRGADNQLVRAMFQALHLLLRRAEERLAVIV